MIKPIETLDKDFDNRHAGLYVVYDSTTNIEVSSPFALINDCAAVGGFVEFMKQNGEKKKPFSKYVLRSIGLYDCVEHRMLSGEEYDIVSDDEDYDNYFNDICEMLKSEEV